MIFKVTYQPNTTQVPTRENTETLYVEAESVVEVRELIAANTGYNVEFVQELSPAHLEYEQSHNPDFKLTGF